MNPKVENFCFKSLENSAKATGMRSMMVIVWLMMWLVCKLYSGETPLIILLLLVASVIGLLLSLRDKHAMAYLGNNPQALKESSVNGQNKQVAVTPLTPRN